MQIRIEAHLILDINTSVSEFAIGNVSSTNEENVSSFSSVARSRSVRKEGLGPEPRCRAVPSDVVSGEGVLVPVEIQTLKSCDTVRECPLFPVLL